MLESRKRDDDIEQESIGTLDDDEESLSISERRARRRAKRQSTSDTEIETNGSTSGAESSLTEGKGAPTRKQRDAQDAREKQQLVFVERLPLIGGFFSYLRGVATEMQKVTWPTREEAQRLTTIVIGVTIVFAIVLGAIDVFLGLWFQQAVESTATFLAIAVPVLLIAGAYTWFFILKEDG